MDAEQVGNLPFQLGVSAAGFGDVTVPLLRRQLADGVKKEFPDFL